MAIIKQETMGDFHVTFENLDNHKCLLITFEGNYHAEFSRKVLSSGLKLIGELDYECCLVDIRAAEYDMSVSQIYQRAMVWDEVGVPRTLKIAHVTTPGSAPRDLSFLENVLTNRGWNIKRFNSMDQALEWIDRKNE